MPITYSFDHTHQLLRANAVMAVTCPEFVAHWKNKRDESFLPLPELFDATSATVAISADEIRLVAQLLLDLGQHTTLGPTAIVTADDISFGTLRMLEILVEDIHSIRPFRCRGEAEQWLQVVLRQCPQAQEEISSMPGIRAD